MTLNYRKMKILLILNILGISLFLTACVDSSIESGKIENSETPMEQITSEEYAITEVENQESSDTVQADNSSDLFYTDPPTMTIGYGDYAINVDACGYSWFYSESEDTETAIMADSAHPLDQNYSERTIILNPANSVHEIHMDFEFNPAQINAITYWPAPEGADYLPHQSMPSPGEEINYDSGISYDNATDITSSNMFLAFEGNYIYEICATFEADRFHGSAYYTVLIRDDAYVIEE